MINSLKVVEGQSKHFNDEKNTQISNKELSSSPPPVEQQQQPKTVSSSSTKSMNLTNTTTNNGDNQNLNTIDVNKNIIKSQLSKSESPSLRKLNIRAQDSSSQYDIPDKARRTRVRGRRRSSASVSSKSFAARSRLAILAQIGEDWLYLALLGTLMALLSFSMDSVITLFLNTRLRLFRDVSDDNLFIQYLGWCVTPIVLVTFSSGFVHLCSPTAIGSGIPEMKTILRGVVLKEYLTFRTLIAKIVGLTFTLGSGLPLGKEGPFVHMASIVATLLSKLVASFQGIYENESRTSEMLSAACAVGVAATFYAPIGGVLFSIEVTTVYFAVRNYWRGFFAACCGATIWRLLGFWIKNDESITALFKTNFRTDYPFDPIELLIFSFIGATCGLAGAAYIKFHRELVQFFRKHKKLSEYFQKHRFVYPIFVTFIITTVTFPPLIGKYTASTLSTHTTIEHLFSNRTWSLGNQDLISKKILDEWTTTNTSFHTHLILYIIMLFWTSAVASTIPIPSGLFIPVLKMGAAYGRLIGELMHSIYPDGISYGEYVHSSAIVPGSYAVVGAAAFSGAVTHTISTSVILFEMTGQIVHIIPVILGVLIANAVCQSLQPSIYDSIIEMKKLPYLPPIASSNSVTHKILVKDFMNTKLAFISKEKYTYLQLKNLLIQHRKINSFPLVESPDSMKLLGSIARFDLLKLLYTHLGRERRLQEVNRRNSDIQQPTIIMRKNSINNNNNNNNKDSIEVKKDDSKIELNNKDFNLPLEELNVNKLFLLENNKNINKKSLDQNNNNNSIDIKRNESESGYTNSVNGGNNPIEEGEKLSNSSTTTSSSTNTTTTTTSPSSPESVNINVDKNLDKIDKTTVIEINSNNVDDYESYSSSSSSSIASGGLKMINDKERESYGGDNNKTTIDNRKFLNSNLENQIKDYGVLEELRTEVESHQKKQLLSSNSHDITIAKMVNHYNRGSSADEDQFDQTLMINLQKGDHQSPKIKIQDYTITNTNDTDESNDKNIQQQQQPQQEQRMRRISKDLNSTIDLSSTDTKLTINNEIIKPRNKSSKDNQNNNFFKRLSPTSFNLVNSKSRHLSTNRPLSPLVELKAASSFNNVNIQSSSLFADDKKQQNSFDLKYSSVDVNSQNISISYRENSTTTINNNNNNNNNNNDGSKTTISRPKSILKTSSTAENLNYMYPRNVSIQSFIINNNNENSDPINKSVLSIENYNNDDQRTRKRLSSLNLLTDSNKIIDTKNYTNFTLGGDSANNINHSSNDLDSFNQIRQRRRVRLPRLRVVDMTLEEQERWEEDQLNALIDITNCQIDEAPFQLVQQTSLYRVHTLFSMLGLNHAYVTSYGRLVGIVALKDIRYAIEEMLQE